MAKSPLLQMAETTPTDYWNDSCNKSELAYGIEHGGVGATTNPTIVYSVMKQEYEEWSKRAKEVIAENPSATEDEVTWTIIEEMAVRGSKMLEPIFKKTGGKKGRISIQTNAKYYRSKDKLVEQTMHFATLFPNLNVKIPATKAGVEAMEEVTYRGVSINATVSFTVAQAVAVAEAVERGMARREAEGLSNDDLAPVVTIMIGRTDDWVKVVANRDNITSNTDYYEWAGVAVVKHAYKIFQEKGYRARLLVAAYRNHYHWSQFIGGDLVLTIPYKWAKRFNESDIPVKNRIDDPVDPAIISELLDKFDEFRKAYEPDGLTPEEFDTYGATVRTLRGFNQSYSDLVGMIRDLMLPNPDVKK